MSTTPKTDTRTDPGRLPMTLPRLAEKKRLHEPIVMVTAYDFPTGQIADAAGVDIVLVGDSGAEVVLGYSSTVAVTIDGDADADRRGAPRRRERAARRRSPVRQLRGLRRGGDPHGAAVRQGGRRGRREARGRRPRDAARGSARSRRAGVP